MSDPKHEKALTTQLNRMKSAFSNYNVVRMREAVRYLSGPKFDLFTKIPFLIHVNRPGFPGYVAGGPEARGIYNFENSGFYKEILNRGDLQGHGLLSEKGKYDPCVLGLYHIGSLGTFTQSAQSDFDYWVIIDKRQFTEPRYYNLKKKLNHIVKYSRESCGQEVTFFIMDQADIQKDCYAGFDSPETMIAPKLFIKEEFYRTFLMIAGKIPLWAILPGNMHKGAYTRIVKGLWGRKDLVPLLKDFIDLGKAEVPEPADIAQGILWHICKSKEDPVKALLKATMILSHSVPQKTTAMLLCDELKQGFARAGIDDYRADPYKLVFDRVIAYHEAHDPKGLNLIKNAIFFRLCEYPIIKAPEPGSPKKQLLDRYIRAWNLTSAQVKKLLSYPTWSEDEKLLLDKTLINRLARMHKKLSTTADMKTICGQAPTSKRNLRILTHKAMERLHTIPGKIPASSTYLTRQSYASFLFKKNQLKQWELSACDGDGTKKIPLYKSATFLGLLGWMIENRLYHREKAQIKIDIEQKLFESRNDDISADALYLALQPVKPLSDDYFDSPVLWTKILVLFICPGSSGSVTGIELLAVNSWGEMFEHQLVLDRALNLDDRYKAVAHRINQYEGDGIRLLFFQMSDRRDTDIVHGVKQLLDNRFRTNRPGTPKRKRPLLDKL